MMAENDEVLSKTGGKCDENSSKMEPNLRSMPCAKLSHKQLKAARKKEVRKIKRQQAAKERDRHLSEVENTESPSYRMRQLQEEKQKKYEEECRERERQLQHALWVERERLALEEIAERKRREEMLRIRQEEEEKRIREEWQERQRQEKEEYERKQEKERAKREKQDALLKEAQSGRKGKDDGSWHNPLAPSNYGQEAEVCPFFAKTGACRFGDQCSRGHPMPESSCTLLFKGMYAHFGLMEGLQDEFDLDITLEYEDSETYHHFREFYEDVLPEFKSIGRVVQFKVCCNYEPHLRGNVYVQYRREEDAHEAFMRFNARWYAGRQLQCEFCSVTRWKNAICGQFRTKKCPKGKNCNFLHVFRNPNGEFWEADRDYDVSEPRSERYQNWHKSDRSFRPSYSREPRRANWDRQGSVRRSRSRSPDRSKRRRSRSPRSVRRSRSPDKSKRRRSRSPESVRRSPRSVRKSRSPDRSKKRRSRSPVSVRRSRSRSPRPVRRSRSRSPRRSCSRSRSRSRSPKHMNSSRNLRKSNRSRSRSPNRDRSRSKIADKRKRSRSGSPNRGTVYRNSNRWNSDSDSDVDSNTRSMNNRSRRSPASPSEKAQHRSRSPSQGSTASKKHKHKKHKKDKKHKHSHSKKDSANDKEGKPKTIPPIVVPSTESTGEQIEDVIHQTNSPPDKNGHSGTDLLSNGSENC